MFGLACSKLSQTFFFRRLLSFSLVNCLFFLSFSKRAIYSAKCEKTKRSMTMFEIKMKLYVTFYCGLNPRHATFDLGILCSCVCIGPKTYRCLLLAVDQLGLSELHILQNIMKNH